MTADTKKASHKVKTELNIDCWSKVLSKLSGSEIAESALVCRLWNFLALKVTARVLRFPWEDDVPKREGDVATWSYHGEVTAGLRRYILARADSLEVVVVSGRYLANTILEAVKTCKRLRILEINDRDASEIVVPILPASLRVLRLGLAIYNFASEWQAEDSSLKVLDCHGLELEACTRQLPMKPLTGLHTLSFATSVISSKMFSDVATIARLLEGLECLHLHLGGHEASSDVFGHLFMLKRLKHLSIYSLHISSPCSQLVASHGNLQTLNLANIMISDILFEDLWKCPQLRLLNVLGGPQVFPHNGMSMSNLQVLSFCDDFTCELNLRLLLSLCPRLSLLEAECKTLHSSTAAIRRKEIHTGLKVIIRVGESDLPFSPPSSLHALGFKITYPGGICQILYGHTDDESGKEDEWGLCATVGLKVQQFLDDFPVSEGLKYCFQYQEAAVYRQFHQSFFSDT